MSEQYPYSEFEHYTEPKDPYEQIDEELRMYKDPAGFRNGVHGLARLYEKTPLMNSLKKYAHLMNVARVSAAGEGDMRKLDANFLVGSVFATHVMLKPAPDNLKLRVLKYDPMRAIVGDKEDAGYIDIIVGELQHWNDGIFEEVYHLQTDIFQEKVMECAVRMYEDQTNPAELQDAFISGFMFASNMIWQRARTPNPV